MLPPLKTGGYIINQNMKDFLHSVDIISHASDLGILLVDEIVVKAGCVPLLNVIEMRYSGNYNMKVFPGEVELEALAEGALHIQRREETANKI